MTQKKVYLIGCGISVEHLTFEAADAIKKAEVILYDRLVDKRILALNNNRKIYVGKKPGQSQKQDEISKLFLKFRNNSIARLHGGDSFIFGRGYEEYLFLRANNIDVKVIPGISAFAFLEKLGLPITLRQGISSVSLITGKRADGQYSYSGLDSDSLIFYMPVKNIGKIIQKIKKHGKHIKDNFFAIENAFKENYRVIDGKINEIVNLCTESKVESPALLAISRFNRKLNGKNILLFRQKESETETKKILKGLNAVNKPLIEIKYRKIKSVPQNKVYAFTSPNSAKSVFSQIKLNGRFVAIGDITKNALAKFGKKASVPKMQTSGGLTEYLKRFNKKEVYVFCSKATNVKGFNKIYCYDAVYLQRPIKKWIDNADIIFPTSPEIIRQLTNLVSLNELNKKTVVVIGPNSALEAKKSGLHVDFMLKKPSIGGLNDLL